jgi:uncharacterized protein YegP (UPF0339 family)
MSAKFVLKRNANGKFHFNLQSANGEIIATSQQYESRMSAEKGIESVRLNAPRAALDDRSEEAAPKPKPPAARKPQAPAAPSSQAPAARA